jgi:hypothetical protein
MHLYKEIVSISPLDSRVFFVEKGELITAKEKNIFRRVTAIFFLEKAFTYN